MKIRTIIFFAPIVILFTACSNNGQEKTTEAKPEQKISIDKNTAATKASLPAFKIVNEEGRVFDLNSLKGKKIFVNLWASWCPPCRAELPSIQKLHQSVDSAKTVFILLSLDNNFDIAKRFKRSGKLSMPIYYPAENLPALFNVQGIPSTFIFDENGALIQQIEGGENYDTEQYRKMLQ